MDRRRFLQMFGGGMVATATMAEAGFLADFMAWIKRMPAWSFPSKTNVCCTIAQYDDFISLSDLAAVYYDRQVLETLSQNFRFTKIARPFSGSNSMPESTGKELTLYSYGR